MEKFPVCIFEEIRGFLYYRDYIRFLSSTKKWREVKFETQIISLEIGNDLGVTVYDHVHSFSKVVKSLNNQIFLSIKNDAEDSILAQCMDMGLKNICFYANNLSNISGWKSKISLRKRVELTKNSDIIDFEGVNMIENLIVRDFAALSNLSGIRNIKEISLYNCTSLADICPLMNLKKVIIENSPLISDIGILRNVRELAVARCPLITDVSQLGGVHLLCLKECFGITDVSSLTRNIYLYIIRCHNIQDYRGLNQVPHLTIDFSPSHSALNSDAHMANCRRMKSKNNSPFCIPFHLTNVIKNCSLIFYPVENLKQSLHQLINLRHLQLSFAMFLETLNISLPKLSCLTIDYCSLLSNIYLEGFPSLLSLDVRCCPHLRKIHFPIDKAISVMKGDAMNRKYNLQSIHLEECPLVKEFDFLPLVHSVSIKNMPSFSDLSIFSSISSDQDVPLDLIDQDNQGGGDRRNSHSATRIFPFICTKVLKIFGCSKLKSLEKLKIPLSWLQIEYCAHIDGSALLEYFIPLFENYGILHEKIVFSQDYSSVIRDIPSLRLFFTEFYILAESWQKADEDTTEELHFLKKPGFYL